MNVAPRRSKEPRGEAEHDTDWIGMAKLTFLPIALSAHSRLGKLPCVQGTPRHLVRGAYLPGNSPPRPGSV